MNNTYELVAVGSGYYHAFRVGVPKFAGDQGNRMQICWEIQGIDNALNYCVGDNLGRPLVLSLTGISGT